MYINNATYQVSVLAISYLKSIGIRSAGENWYRCITSRMLRNFYQINHAASALLSISIILLLQCGHLRSFESFDLVVAYQC